MLQTSREKKRTIRTDSNEIKSPTEKSANLRPKTLKEYTGQEEIKKNLVVALESAKIRQTPLDHVLLYGPPGLGKTSLAYIIANEMGTDLKYLSGPAIEKPGDVCSALSSLQDNACLFIDEIHRMDRSAEEVLYSAMEDGFVTITIGHGKEQKVIKLDLPKFTLIGATTRAGMLSAPLRDRFGHVFKLDFYKDSELAVIAKNASEKFGLLFDDDVCMAIAKASRGTPRIALRNTARVRDYCIISNNTKADISTVNLALSSMGISDEGLDNMDLNIMKRLAESVSPIGIQTLADMIGEDAQTLETVYEPYLLRQGYIEKTGRGRVITDEGRKKIPLT